WAERHGVPKWYERAEDLLADDEIDAVYVATPPSSHAELTIAAARAKKPVYVEKPMATSAAECDAMLAACREANVPLFVAYYRRALPRFLHVKELLDGGVIGAVRVVSATLCRKVRDDDRAEHLPWRVRPEVSGGGHFVDLACHTLDLLDFLLGP